MPSASAFRIADGTFYRTDSVSRESGRSDGNGASKTPYKGAPIG